MVSLIKRKNNAPKSTSTINKWSESIASQMNKVDNQVNVQYIPTDQIVVDESNPRKISINAQDIEKNKSIFEHMLASDKEEIDQAQCLKSFKNSSKKVEDAINLTELAKSIGNKDNLINPIIVYHEQFKFYIVAGHRRFFAHKILGEKLIKASILEKKPSKIETSILQWKENEDREDLTVYEKIINVENIISMLDSDQKKSLSSAKLADLINTGKTTAKLYLSVMKEKNSNQMFKKALENNFIKSLLAAYKISNIKDDAEKTKILKDIIKNEKTAAISINKASKNNAKKAPIKRHQVLNLSKVDNIKPMANIIHTLIHSEALSGHKNDLAKMKLSTKADLLAAWKQIYNLFEKVD